MPDPSIGDPDDPLLHIFHAAVAFGISRLFWSLFLQMEVCASRKVRLVRTRVVHVLSRYHFHQI